MTSIAVEAAATSKSSSIGSSSEKMDNVVHMYIHAGVLISEGVMYRLQWSWDLKMCPY